MEEHQKQKTKRKRRIAMMKKKKKKKKKNMRNHETVFPLLFASFCSRPHGETALIKKCLNKILLSLPHFHLPPILALLPSLLKSDCAEIVCKSAEIVGAASLALFEMSEQIAAEDDLLKRLIALLRNSERRIAIAACNAVLDLSVASVGRQRLLQFGAIENFMNFFPFSQSVYFLPNADLQIPSLANSANILLKFTGSEEYSPIFFTKRADCRVLSMEAM